MLKKRFAFAISIILLAALVVSCSKETNISGNNELQEAQTSAGVGNNSEKVLKVYYLQQDAEVNTSALNEFKKNHKDIKIEEKVIADDEVQSFDLFERIALNFVEGLVLLNFYEIMQ